MASTLEGERFTFLTPVAPICFWDLDPETYYIQAAPSGDPAMETDTACGLGRISAFAMGTFPLFVQEVSSGILPESADPPFPPVYPYFFSTDLVYGRDKMNTVIRVVRGDSYSFDVAVLLDDEPYQLTNVSLTMTAKWSREDSDANAVFQKTLTSGITITSVADGTLQIDLSPSDTASLPPTEVVLKYDIQLVDGLKVYTVARGDLYVSPDVTVGV